MTTFTHFFNVFLSVFLHTKGESAVGKADQCAWYFTTFLLDLFPGMLMVYALNTLLEAFFRSRNLRKFMNGNYALSPQSEVIRIDFEGYAAETFVWLCIQMFVKLVLLLIYVFFLEGLSTLGYYLLKVLDFSKGFKLAFVMVIFPIIVDVICFTISDTLLKKNTWEADELGLLSSYYDDVNDFGGVGATSLYHPQIVTRDSVPNHDDLGRHQSGWMFERISQHELQ